MELEITNKHDPLLLPSTAQSPTSRPLSGHRTSGSPQAQFCAFCAFCGQRIRSFLCVFAALCARIFSCCLILLPASAFGQVTWKTSLPAAKLAAAISGKPILLMFHATWCGPCKEMEETTFHDPGVVKLLQDLTCVKLDVDKDEATAKAFGVNSIPRILILPVSGANQPLMDTLGYQDAEQFAGSLSAALHVKAPPTVPAASDNPDLMEVRKALGDHSFAKLQLTSPTVASAGLKKLVEELGVFQEHDIDPTLDLLRGAGDSAVPALFAGMNNRYLAVRTGSYRALQTILRERHVTTSLQFDPWASAASRQHQIDQWTKWWNGRKKG